MFAKVYLDSVVWSGRVLTSFGTALAFRDTDELGEISFSFG